MSSIQHHIISGSDINVLFNSGSAPVAGIHLMNDGGVQIFMTEPPLNASDDDMSEWSDACNVTDYLLYALENQRWIAQWHFHQKGLWEDAVEKSKIREKDRMRSILTLLPGGKSGSGD